MSVDRLLFHALNPFSLTAHILNDLAVNDRQGSFSVLLAAVTPVDLSV